VINISKITNRKTADNKKAIKKVQEIMKIQFPEINEEETNNLPYRIFGGPKMGFVYELYIAKDENEEIIGFIVYSYFPRYNFYFLDHLAVSPSLTGKGIGGKLYEFLRAKAKEKDSIGIFYECMNDDPDQQIKKEILEQNISRLKFYERYGARPIINNAFHEKINEDDYSTLLVFDPLDVPPVLHRDMARKIVRKIIQKKYSDYLSPDHIKKVTASIKENPVAIRESKYIKKEQEKINNIKQ